MQCRLPIPVLLDGIGSVLDQFERKCLQLRLLVVSVTQKAVEWGIPPPTPSYRDTGLESCLQLLAFNPHEVGIFHLPLEEEVVELRLCCPHDAIAGEVPP